MLIENINTLNEDVLFEMANIKANRTGLKYDIWLDSLGVDRKNEHSNPRIKIQVDNNLIPIEISNDPQIPDSVMKNLGKEFISNFPQVKKWVKAYKDILLAHYYKKIDDIQAGNLLSVIGRAASSIEKLNQLLDRSNIKYVEFYWDDTQTLYVIEAKNSLNEIIDTIYASDQFNLNKELSLLKIENKNLIIKEKQS